MNKDTITKSAIVGIVVIGLVAAAVVYNGMDSNDRSSGTMSNMDESMNDDTTSSPSTEMTDTNMVTYKNFKVAQPMIRIKKGTTVTWTNEDNAKHDVTPTNATEEFKASELFGKGETHSVTFNTVGTFEYICSPHPYMKGTVEVVEA